MKVVFNPGNLKRPELASTRKNSLSFFRENLTKIPLSVADLLGFFFFFFVFCILLSCIVFVFRIWFFFSSYYYSIDNGQIVMAEIILAWQIAERAEREGVAVEDYCKKKGIDDARRYSEINLAGLLLSLSLLLLFIVLPVLLPFYYPHSFLIVSFLLPFPLF